MSTSRISAARTAAIAVVAIVTVVGCGSGSVPSSGTSAGSGTSPGGGGGGGARASASPSSLSFAPGLSSAGIAAPSSGATASTIAIGVPDTCALVSPAEIETAVGMAFEPGQDVTAETGWSSACAWVQQVPAGQSPYNVNVKVLATGTLVTFAKMAGARPVAGLGDEAYAFDDGRQIAIRFGQLVAVVAGARGIDGKGVPATAVEALARLVAGRIPR
jgi:hypothetical protein